MVSTIGTRITGVAYPLLVLALTGSPAKAGIVGFAQSLPYMLFFLPAGALVDRWNRKRIMLVADAGRSVALGAIAILLAVDALPFAVIVVVAFVEGTFFVFFSLSETAALPQIVAKEQLPTAVAQNQARVQGADLVGQPLGGALFGINRLLPFAVDAGSYAVSFVSLLFVRPAFQEERPRSASRLRAEMLEGVVWLWRMPFLRTTVFLVAGSNFAFNAIYLAMIVRAQDLGAGPGVIGSCWRCRERELYSDRRSLPGRTGTCTRSSSSSAPSGSGPRRRSCCRSCTARSDWGSSGGLAGIFGPVFNVTLASYRYALVPDRLLARVGSAALVVAWGAVPLGALAAGFLLEQLGAVDTIRVLAGVMVAVGIAAALSRSVRTAPHISELQGVS